MLGNSVETIDKKAFWGCINLQNIVIPNSVKKIRDRSFY
ncbi:MAG: leucine-rich repeat protein [Paludibacteraceae bacterium]|nr:leucine-rich repeat protein [Paludibacteraceae bacterium]